MINGDNLKGRCCCCGSCKCKVVTLRVSKKQKRMPDADEGSGRDKKILRWDAGQNQHEILRKILRSQQISIHLHIITNGATEVLLVRQVLPKFLEICVQLGIHADF